MPACTVTRRAALAVGMGAALAPLLPRPARAATLLDFDEMYGAQGVFGLTFSERLKSLAGASVAMRGFMAPPLQAEADFFVLTEIPMAICPFCSSDADWPDNIVMVRLGRTQTFEQANARIEVTGTLEVGSATDARTGFVSLVRLVGARYARV